MKEAIKVKLKHDKHGMGHNAGEEFTFHWWDHVFNKAASSISVEQNEQGIKVKKVAENGPIRNKKTKTFCDKKLLYGQFVKGATLDNNVETQDEHSLEDESNSEDEQVLNKLDDSAMMKICGGMTAHKAARHGLKLNGKLLRIEEQEKVLLEKYGKKLNKPEDSGVDNSVVESQNPSKKAKKRKKKKQNESLCNDSSSSVNSTVIMSNVCDGDKDGKVVQRPRESVEDCQRIETNDEVNKKSKKRKRHSKNSEFCKTMAENENLSSNSISEDVTHVVKKKKKKCKK